MQKSGTGLANGTHMPLLSRIAASAWQGLGLCHAKICARLSSPMLADGTPSAEGRLCHLQVIREIEQELTKWKESGRWEEKGSLAQVAEEGHTWAY